MKRWVLILVFSASAAAQTGLGSSQKTSQPNKPADAAARGGAGQKPAPPEGSAAQPAPAAATGGRGAAPAAAAVATPKDLRYQPLRTIQLPHITTATLPNGLKISMMEDHELPVISGAALVRAGNLMDPPEKIGLAAAVGSLLRNGGTTVKSVDQVDSLLESMAAGIESATEESFTRITFSTVSENAETVLGLFKEVLTQPEFRSDKIDAVRAQLRTLVAQRNEDPNIISHREFASLMYGKDNPYGWIPEYATVARISRNDIRAFYRRYYFPANVTLGVWGDFDAAQMKAAIEKLFGDWNAPAQPPPDSPKMAQSPAPGVYLAEKKDLGDTSFTIGHLGGRANDKDVAPLQVMAAILGASGGKHGRLAEKVRARTGAPHEIRALWLTAYDHPGLFEIAGSTRSVNTVDVIKVILAEVERIRTAEVTEEELQTAKGSLLNGMVFAYDTKAKLMGRQLMFQFFGYPADYLQQHQKALQAVTRADVLRVAKQYINPANFAIVAVANPLMLGSEPMERLTASATVNKLDLTIPEARPEAIPTTDASLAEGKQILQKAQAAMGGLEKLAAIKDYTEVGNYQIDPSVPTIGGSKITETDRWIAPTVFRQESVLPAGRVAAYTDGRVGWIATPQGWGGLAGTQQKQVFSDLFRSWFRLILSDRIEGRTVNAMESNALQITDTAGQEAKVEFDPATWLPRRVTYDTQQAMGGPLYTEDVFEDYRDVDGIKLPFKITINQGGRKFADVTVSEYKLNSGLKPTDLARRPQ